MQLFAASKGIGKGVQKRWLSTPSKIQTYHPAMPKAGSKPDKHGQIEFVFNHEFNLHRLANGPSKVALASKEDMLGFYKQMVTIRRMELAADALYKAKLIRGFCHLQTGQEAVPVGIESALTKEDALITAYRCHGYTLLRGGTIRSVLAELLGRSTGVSKGKGGSMHMYGENFFGGNGIVGAQVPLGAGVALAQQYLGKPNCTFALYGDGAANQGQIFEAFNMAALWKLPVVFVCENNFYSMGTSLQRSAASTQHYTRGDYIPGIQVNGMDVLAVREAARFAKEWTVGGKGPILLEMLTYRYGGHSMSDPGTSYRTRDEIKAIRDSIDALSQCAQQIIGAGFGTSEELKELEKAIRVEVDEAVEQAKADPLPENSTFFEDVYIGSSQRVRTCEPL